MKEEILDEIKNNEADNKAVIIRIIQISVVTIFLFFLIEILRDFLPENLLDWEGIQIRTAGLIIFGIVILNSILIPNYLNKIKPALHGLKIVVYTGLIICFIEFTFKFIQNILLMNNLQNLEYLTTLKLGGIFGLIGMLIANITIHKIRKKSILIPVLLLIGIWILMGLLLRK